MPSWKAWVQRPTGLVKMNEEAQGLKGQKLDISR